MSCIYSFGLSASPVSWIEKAYNFTTFFWNDVRFVEKTFFLFLSTLLAIKSLYFRSPISYSKVHFTWTLIIYLW